jgi:hypothetical protein
MATHSYQSAKGDNFLTWHQWAETNLTPAEFEIYIHPDNSEEKTALYNRWVADEQITRHHITNDDGSTEIVTYPEA